MTPLYALQHKALATMLLHLSPDNVKYTFESKSEGLIAYTMAYAITKTQPQDYWNDLRYGHTHRFIKIGGYDAFIIEFQPFRSERFNPTECPYVFFVNTPDRPRYFTFEYSFGDSYALCEWDRSECHLNYGFFEGKELAPILEKIKQITAA